MFVGCCQLMWAVVNLMWVWTLLYCQLIWVEKPDVCGFERLCLQVATGRHPLWVRDFLAGNDWHKGDDLDTMRTILKEVLIEQD